MTEFTPGMPAFDVIQQSYVVVTDSHMTSIEALSDETRQAVETNYGNKLLGVAPETPCVDVAYLSIDGESKRSYTFPTNRLVVPDISGATEHGLSVTGLTEATLATRVVRLMAESDEEVDPAWVGAIFKRAGVHHEPVDRVVYEVKERA